MLQALSGRAVTMGIPLGILLLTRRVGGGCQVAPALHPEVAQR